ncbi:MAG TPA: DUF4396 domain-containing protein [Rhizomicrobium sp.]|jgi:hypothetical protein|nr:DUF4396 domain-containing protein [Rhizomicrobium sp.]
MHDHGHHHSHDHAGHGPHHNQWTAAAHATLHCSIGCIIGETVGLMLGTTLHFSQVESMAVSTVLAYCAGFTLAATPLMRRTGLSLGAALGAIWIGEGISIGVMEIVMNAIDYQMGGMRTGSIFNMRFWAALAVATAVAFVIAWPVNAWLIAKKIKEHH